MTIRSYSVLKCTGEYRANTQDMGQSRIPSPGQSVSMNVCECGCERTNVEGFELNASERLGSWPADGVAGGWRGSHSQARHLSSILVLQKRHNTRRHDTTR